MITHHFETDTKFEMAGYFADDYGRRLGSWTWDGKTIRVTAASTTRPQSLEQFDLTKYSDEDLRERLVNLAKEITEDLRGEPFPT